MRLLRAESSHSSGRKHHLLNLKVFDSESKGYLTWRDVKNLCKQSFQVTVDAKVDGRDEGSQLYTNQKRFFVESGQFNNDELDDEISKLE